MSLFSMSPSPTEKLAHSEVVDQLQLQVFLANLTYIILELLVEVYGEQKMAEKRTKTFLMVFLAEVLAQLLLQVTILM